MKEYFIYISYKTLLAFGYVYFITTLSNTDSAYYSYFSINFSLVTVISTMGTAWITQAALRNSDLYIKSIQPEYFTIFYANLALIFAVSYILSDLNFAILSVLTSIGMLIITIAQVHKSYKALLYTEGLRGIIILCFCLIIQHHSMNVDGHIFQIIWSISYIPTVIYVTIKTRIKFNWNELIYVFKQSAKYGAWISLWLGGFNYIFYLDRLAIIRVEPNNLETYDVVSRVIPFVIQPYAMRLLRGLLRDEKSASIIETKKKIYRICARYLLACLIIILTIYTTIDQNIINTKTFHGSRPESIIYFLIMSFSWQIAPLFQKIAEKQGKTAQMALYMFGSVIVYTTLSTLASTLFEILLYNIASVLLYIILLNRLYKSIR